jgi:hypothetical protein
MLQLGVYTSVFQYGKNIWSKWGPKNPRADSNVLVIVPGAEAMTDKSLFCYPKRAKNILLIGRNNVSYSDLRILVQDQEENTPLV